MPDKEKKTLRDEYLIKRDGLSSKMRHQMSAAILENLIRSPIYKSANDIGFYCSFGSEVETSEMMSRAITDNKSIYLPVIAPSDKKMHFCHFDGDVCCLTCNSFGIMEPKKMPAIADQVLDLIIVPGLIFTKNGWRIGHGAGYYDRYLKIVDATTSGVAFSTQMRESIPKGKFDVPLDYVITEKELFIRNEPKPVFSGFQK